jgi:hypothetical protein
VNFVRARKNDIEADSSAEDTDAVLFDADGNGSLDLVVVGGGGGVDRNTLEDLQPRLYLNNGRELKKQRGGCRKFLWTHHALRRQILTVMADKDLFIGGRVIAGNYGMDPRVFFC